MKIMEAITGFALMSAPIAASWIYYGMTGNLMSFGG